MRIQLFIEDWKHRRDVNHYKAVIIFLLLITNFGLPKLSSSSS